MTIAVSTNAWGTGSTATCDMFSTVTTSPSIIGAVRPDKYPRATIKMFRPVLKTVSETDVYYTFLENYNNCTIRYGDLKKQLAEDIIKFTTPFRERISDIIEDVDYLNKMRLIGKEKASESASKTLEEVRNIVGFKNKFI